MGFDGTLAVYSNIRMEKGFRLTKNSIALATGWEMVIRFINRHTSTLFDWPYRLAVAL